MIEKVDLFCPNLKRKVHIEISIPKHRNKEDVFDSLYMLDGQNIYKDKDASFGHSLHMERYLSIMSLKYGKRICGIAIYNAGSDRGRTNEYSPFKLEGNAKSLIKRQRLEVCEAFTYDFINTIIPYIQEHYPVKKEAENTFMFGSSLGALYTTFITNKYPNYFGGAGLFSNCPFICENAFYAFLEKNLNKDLKVFNYVGLEETSDGSFDKTLYYNSTLKLHKFFMEKGLKTKLVIDCYGVHNEKTWEKHIMQFLSFLYFDDFELCN